MKRLNTISVLLAGAAVSMAMASAAVAGGAAYPPLATLGNPTIPPDNKQSAAKIELGKMLFFDPRLGGDASTACVSCHEPDQGWSFGDSLSRGYPGTVHWRNSQTIVNAAFLGKLFWAGAAKSLEAQAPSAAKGAVAGNGENDVMETRLAFIPEYRKRFREVFGDRWPHVNDAWRAIASFERTMIYKDTPLDHYLAGDKTALSKQQLRGMKLFNGKAGCIRCHNGSLASDQKYYNLGVPRADRWLDDGMAQISFRYEQYAKGVTQKIYRKIKDDAGLYYRTKERSDMGKFRTPPLRYIAYTAPYMHNGTFWDLESVVQFYNAGGGSNEFTDGTMASNKTPLLKPLGLSDAEVADLVAFLDAFSGPELKVKAPTLPPYGPLAQK